MRGGEANGCSWVELARVPAPVARRSLWKALLQKTEHPERYNAAVRGAEVIDHDATVVVRRTHANDREPYLEWITHARADARVELRRHGRRWRRAQALVDTSTGPCLVYQVDDPDAAATDGGIEPAYARSVLEQLVSTAKALDAVVF